MPIQELERGYLLTPTLEKYDVLSQPDAGGRQESVSPFDATVIIAQSSDRILSPAEAQRPQIQPIELAPNLVFNPIPKWDGVMEMNRFINDINTGLAEGKSFVDAVNKSAHELEMNVRAYDSEIIKSKAVLLHLNRFDLVDGVVRIVGNNGKPVVDSVSAQERRGSVLDASRDAENSLIAAENNTLAVLMNPAGWHGFTDQYGREASPHRNAQTLVFWKDKKGDLKGLTFHVDLELEQAKNVMLSLGVSKEDLTGATDRDQIVNIVRHPALLSLPETYDNPFEYVLDKILAARGDHAFRLLQENGKIEIRPIDQAKIDVKRFETLLQGNQEEENHIAGLIKYISAESLNVRMAEVQQQIICLVEKTLLRLTRVYLQGKDQTPGLLFNNVPVVPVLYPSDYSRPLYEQGDDFTREIAYLKTRAGCPASMSSAISLSGISLGSSAESVGTSLGLLESDSKGSLYFPCPACGTINKRPREGYVDSCKNKECPNPKAVRC